MKLNDLSDIEIETLTDRCYNDLILVEDFVASNNDLFEEYMDYDIDREDMTEYELRFCEANLDDFVKFGFNKYYGVK